MKITLYTAIKDEFAQDSTWKRCSDITSTSRRKQWCEGVICRDVFAYLAERSQFWRVPLANATA